MSRFSIRPEVVFLIVLVGVCLSAPLFALRDPLYAESGNELRPPSLEHPLGTDLLGRDVMSRLLYGGSRTLGIAALAAGLAVGPGLLLGTLIAVSPAWIDTLATILLDALLAFPGFLLALVVLAVFGSGTLQIGLAVGFAGLPAYTRVVRASLRAVSNRLYVDAARAVGARPLRIVFAHIFPSAAAPLSAFAAVTFSWALLNSAALAFLGFGGDLSAPDWGTMLNQGRPVLRIAPWIALAPGALISLTIFSVNRLADRLTELPGAGHRRQK